mgnify:FL=1
MKRVQAPTGNHSLFLPSIPEASNAPIAANLIASGDYQVAILVDESISKSELWGEDTLGFLEFLQPKKRLSFYVFDCPPSPSHPDAFERDCDRISVLSKMLSADEQSDVNDCILIATTPDALLSPCPSPLDQKRTELTINRGQELHFESFCRELATNLGYSSEILCEEPGQFAVRGGLVDVYPINGDRPIRVDFFGDDIEEIRAFDPTSQRTSDQLDHAHLSSAKIEQQDEKEGEFFRYLKSSTLWYVREPEILLGRYPLAFHEADQKAARKANFSLAWKSHPGNRSFFLGSSEIDAGAGIFEASERRELVIHATSRELNWKSSAVFHEGAFENEKRNRVSSLFQLLQRQDEGHEIIIAVGAEAEKKRISDLIKEESSLHRLAPTFVPVGINEGIRIPKGEPMDLMNQFLGHPGSGLALVASKDLLGRERSRRPTRSRKARVQKKEVDQALDFSELIDGDYLVHHQHGICRFNSLGRMEEENAGEEAITVEFDDGLLLHVPLQESHLLSRYVGLSKSKPKLAKIGGKSWAKTRQAAELAALDLAADLLRLQASRESHSGHAFSPDDQWQKEFEDAFPFTETVDQQKAIDQVKRDMEAEEPMDRLVCGDVGFGKTEVALRAAFKAVMDGKQVAILCPTTILCQQHLNSFRERMIDFPITLDMLSRFRTGRQQSKILEALRMGSLDLVIGTHRLLSNDVSFKDLGLLVIDEEQRFGVQDKEAIKKLKASVDVLTLSATPIPRTLYFAMVGARSLSAIETAPVNRLPIRTEVLHKSDDVLLKAINAEIRRNGQIFYLHNRVKTIRSVARKLETLFPKLRIAVGHGQMSEDELEKVMTDFVAGEFDILVCTTIIESGLDIPNCNTIIIEGADKFGLSQLYQLRGRVGRFTRQAYAYLLLNRHLTVSDQAKKRLSAIRQVNQFGAGFRIALRDLELRGAGNLLGSEQSGHIAGVGFELYCRLLKESVSRLKGDEISLRPSAVIRLDFLSPLGDIKAKDSMKALEACIPESYAAEPRLRIEIYRKLAQFQSTDEVKEYGEELEDRFGTPPDEVRALLMETEIRCLCEEANFDKLEVKQGEIFLRLVRKAGDKNLKFLRLAGKIPRLSSKTPLLKLKELIAFLKIRIHGNMENKA